METQTSDGTQQAGGLIDDDFVAPDEEVGPVRFPSASTRSPSSPSPGPHVDRRLMYRGVSSVAVSRNLSPHTSLAAMVLDSTPRLSPPPGPVPPAAPQPFQFDGEVLTLLSRLRNLLAALGRGQAPSCWRPDGTVHAGGEQQCVRTIPVTETRRKHTFKVLSYVMFQHLSSCRFARQQGPQWNCAYDGLRLVQIVQQDCRFRRVKLSPRRVTRFDKVCDTGGDVKTQRFENDGFNDR